MKKNASFFNMTNYQVKFIDDLKYRVHNNSKKYALETARKVEGLFIYILLKNMRNSLTKDDILSNNQSKLYTEVYDEKISTEIANKGIGLTKVILEQIKKTRSYK